MNLSVNAFKSLAIGQRKFWHKDAKWICSILLLMSLAFTLPVVSLYRLTAKEPATKALSYTLAGLTSPSGIDSSDGVNTLEQKTLKTGRTTVNIAGIPVTFTAKDFRTLSPRDLRLKVFNAFADQFYDKGAVGFVKSQGLGDDTAQQFKKNSSTIALFTKSTHQKLGKFTDILVLIDIALAAALVVFSYRFGRLASLGLVLLIAALPAIILSAASSNHHTVSGTARPDSATSTASAIGTFTSFVAPLVLPYFAGTYMFVFLFGLALLLASGIGLFVYKKVLKRGKTTSAELARD